MPRTYGKLVRDRIPDIIRAEGRACEIEIMDEASYRSALLAKLLEEATEIASASAADLTTEIADLYEVIDAIVRANGLSEDEIRQVQQQRRESRGGFVRRIKLLQTD